MKPEIKEYIESIKKDFVHWLVNNMPEYPHVCGEVSWVFAGLLQEKFGIGEVVHGYYKKERDLHTWIEVEDFIIDFTFFQFSYPVSKEEEANQLVESLRVTDDKDLIFRTLIEEKQGDIYFSKDTEGFVRTASPVPDDYDNECIEEEILDEPSLLFAYPYVEWMQDWSLSTYLEEVTDLLFRKGIFDRFIVEELHTIEDFHAFMQRKRYTA